MKFSEVKGISDKLESLRKILSENSFVQDTDSSNSKKDEEKDKKEDLEKLRK